MPSDLCISVDSTTPISEEQKEKYNFISTSLVYIMDGEEHVDQFADELEKSNFFEKLRNGAEAASKSASPKHFMNTWKPALEQGKSILHLSISSHVSTAYESASIAAEALNAVYPDKVHVFDTLIGGACVTEMAIDAAELAKQGATIQEITSWLNQEKKKYNMMMCVDDISHAKRDGIINTFQAAIGSAIGIKPVLYATEQGGIEMLSITRGLKNAYALVTEIIDAVKTDETTWVSVSHAGDEYNALMMVESAREKIKQVKDTEVSVLSPVLGINGGPGLVAIYFKGKERKAIYEYIQNKKKK